MITLLGATGYVGRKFVAALEKSEFSFEALSRADLDYTQPALLEAYLQGKRPEFVINAAGYTGKPNVDACEFDKANCLNGNAVLPGMLVDVCRRLEIPWGHVSSGCIFTGKRSDGKGFRETDVPNFTFRQNNCSFYSGTKALGEEAVGYGLDATGEQWIPTRPETGYIWRLRIPFNHEASPRNYIAKLLHYERLLDAENSISHLESFVGACLASWCRRIPFGIYNVTNPGSITAREMVDLIKKSKMGKQLLKQGKTFEFFENEAEFMETTAKTPRSNCVMDSTKLENAGIQLTPVRTAVEDALNNWTKQ